MNLFDTDPERLRRSNDTGDGDWWDQLIAGSPLWSSEGALAREYVPIVDPDTREHASRHGIPANFPFVRAFTTRAGTAAADDSSVDDSSVDETVNGLAPDGAPDHADILGPGVGSAAAAPHAGDAGSGAPAGADADAARTDAARTDAGRTAGGAADGAFPDGVSPGCASPDAASPGWRWGYPGTYSGASGGASVGASGGASGGAEGAGRNDAGRDQDAGGSGSSSWVAVAAVGEAARAVALVPVPESAQVCLAEAEELLAARDRITSALAARVGRVHRAGEAKNHGHASTR
ncbi:hypothetical protein FXF59_33655, partial [Microbispora tritici]